MFCKAMVGACMLFSMVNCAAQSLSEAAQVKPDAATYRRLANEVDDALQHHVLAQWYPRSIDKEHGGFHADFDRSWRWQPSEGKFSVFEGRMTWVAAQAVLHEPSQKEKYLPAVRQGVSFLKNVQWDKEKGGFFWGLDDEGKITPHFGDGKHLYGVAFGIYGAAAAYRATQDPQALELAKQGFLWADEHGHDSLNGGYFESLDREGRPLPPRIVAGHVEENVIGPIGFKSMNTHIHLMEAYTELYQVWPDARLRARLEELLAIVRDRICVAPGAMNLFFTDAWQPLPGHDSYGHDVETAYLMLETDAVLHGKASEKTEVMAKMLVDHALAYGWDEKNGGMVREGGSYTPQEDLLKEWWVQCEDLNALLMMHERYGQSSPVYFKRFVQQWEFIKAHTIDGVQGGLFNLTEADGRPIKDAKGSIWKGAYHDSRAFWNVRERLRKLAADGEPR